QKHARRRRHRQGRRVMLGEMIAVETGGLGRLQQGEPILVGLLQRLAARVDVVEDAELHVAFPPPLRRIFWPEPKPANAKPSIAAARRLSPNGRHLRLVMPGPDPRQVWQWRRSNLPSPAGLTAQVGQARLAVSIPAMTISVRWIWRESNG